MRTEIPIPTERLEEFCRRWKIAELRVFGSALREDFRPDSDLDLLVGFESGADSSLLDHVAMEQELSGLVGRKVDLVSQRAIERSSNWIRRKGHPGERGAILCLAMTRTFSTSLKAARCAAITSSVISWTARRRGGTGWPRETKAAH